MNIKEECCKWRNCIDFLENAVCVETGRMGQEWQVIYGFIINNLKSYITNVRLKHLQTLLISLYLLHQSDFFLDYQCQVHLVLHHL